MDYIETFRYLIMAFWGVLTGLFIMSAIWLVYSKETDKNTDDKLSSWKGRKREIARLASRIRTGQSSAILGLFSEEKTEILRHLNNQNPQQRQMLYRDKANELVFSYIDIAMELSEHDTPVKFWEMALAGVQRIIRPDSEMAEVYQACVDSQFKKSEVENLLTLMVQEGKRLVLLLDHFERLVEYGEFKNNWEFFTTLRRFATSQEPPLLTLVIATNLSLPRLHEEIQQNQKTSPVLNFIEVTPIMGLSEQEVDKLLREEVPQLSEEQRNFVKDMTGGHPYLLKIATANLIEELANSPKTIEEIVCSKVKDSVKRTLSSWSPNTCQTLQLIRRQEDVSGFENELKELKIQGIIVKKSDKWQIHARIFEKCLTGTDIAQECGTRWKKGVECHDT